MTSPDYDNQFLTVLQDCNFAENKVMDVRNRLANAAASHQSIPLTNQDLDIIAERNEAWKSSSSLPGTRSDNVQFTLSSFGRSYACAIYILSRQLL